MLMEEITHGERIRKYVVEAKVGDDWQKVGGGTCIGHKRIQKFDPVSVTAVRLRVLESAGVPFIRKLDVFNTTAASAQ